MQGKFGEILTTEGILTAEQLGEALEYQKAHGGRLGDALVALGFLTDDELVAVLSRVHGIPSMNLSRFRIDPGVLHLVSRETATKYQVMPLSRVGSSLTLAVADPTRLNCVDEIHSITGFHIEPVLASEKAIMQAITKHYVTGNAEDVERKKEIDGIVSMIDPGQSERAEFDAADEGTLTLSALEEVAEESPMVKLVNYILVDAVRRGASEIHLEPFEMDYRVRYRIEGSLQTIMSPPFKLRDAITSRVKTMAKLNLIERRLPQNGRMFIKMKHEGKIKEVHCLVSVVPTLHGEKAVIQLRDRATLRLNLAKLGLEPESLATFQRAIEGRSRLVLVTGPSGSGKTTTMYSSLATLNKSNVNIVTVEDPVEFLLAGITQAEVRVQAGMTFRTALSSLLEQNPDIIMVGNIRDSETAQLTFDAASKGPLVLSCMESNDAPSAISLLTKMGIEPSLIAKLVSLVSAQRLVRVICVRCKVVEAVSPQLLIAMGLTPEEAETVQPYKGRGCNECNNAGYKGRVGLFEVMKMTDELRSLINGRVPLPELRRKAIEQGMITLRQSGLIKVREGITSLEEVLSNTSGD